MRLKTDQQSICSYSTTTDYPRNDITQQTIKLALQRSDAILYTKDGQFDLSNPSDRLFKTILDGIASYDNALRAERTRLGKVAKVKAGNWYGGAATIWIPKCQ